MSIADTLSIIANIFFSASAAGTVVLVIFFAASRLLRKNALDGIMLKLAVIFAVLWIIDIGMYIYLSFVI
jgi:hypothetical protein